MALPIVAIVGRPNVGKSSLFNAITRTRTSIVEATAGVTRDRVSAITDINDEYFELVDTGGYGIVDRDDLTSHVEQQIEYAVRQASMILFVVDGREGVNPLDRRTADLLRAHQDHVYLLANKVDELHMDTQLGDFVRLGFGEPMPVSANSGLGRRTLLELIAKHVGNEANIRPEDAAIKIALVGKRNAGKSTFVNSLAGEDRVIVSEVPGTTRDSIDVRFEKDGRVLVAIDTAGIRKKAKIADDIEFYAYSRATLSIERADVVLFLIDATEPVSQVDKKLSQFISQAYKPCILVVNKWDLAKGKSDTEAYGEYLTKTLRELDYAPIAFTTAETGRNIDSTIDLATEMYKQSCERVGTGELNRALEVALAANAPKAKKGTKRPKFFYATQVSTSPPTIIIFVNNPSAVKMDYQRFLINRFRESLPFDEIPIRLVFKARRQTERL